MHLTLKKEATKPASFNFLQQQEPADKAANRIAAVRDLRPEEARAGFHAETVREIRAEYPNADERETKLRVAIRESLCMTQYEEETIYERISEALA